MNHQTQGKISIEIEGNIPVDQFVEFYKNLKKIDDLFICHYCADYINIHYGLNINEIDKKSSILKEYDHLVSKNILKIETTIKKPNYIPTEIVIQKYDLYNKNTLKTVRKIGKIYNKYQEPIDPYEAIHVNFDARSFYPYLKEIYDRNFELFDLNEKYRRKVYKSILIYPKKEKIKFRKIFSIDQSNIEKQGRVEFRIFNSNKEGRKKLLKFLNNSKKTVKEGYKDFNLICFDENDILGQSSTKITQPKTANTLLKTQEKFKNIKELIKEHKKGNSFIVDEFFSMSFEDYDKIL